MPWKNVSHNGYKVLTCSVASHLSVANNYTPEFSVAPGKDFYVIANYGATTLSATGHVEIYYSDVPGGTFARRANKASFNATTALIQSAAKTLLCDVSVSGEFPRYKLKVTGPNGACAGGNVKFVVIWGEAPVTNVT